MLQGRSCHTTMLPAVHVCVACVFVSSLDGPAGVLAPCSANLSPLTAHNPPPQKKPHRYSESDKVAMNVGFYYMANALGRLTYPHCVLRVCTHALSPIAQIL